MKIAAILALAFSLQAQTITGTFKNPSTAGFNGTLSVRLTTSTVVNWCNGTDQLQAFQNVSVPVTNGTFPGFVLYPSPCMVAQFIPTAVTGPAAAGGIVSVSPGSTNLGGTLLFTVGSNAPAGVLVTLTYGAGVLGPMTKYKPAPVCHLVLSPAMPGFGYRPGATSIQFLTTTPFTGGAYWLGYVCGVTPYQVQLHDAKNQLVMNSEWVVPYVASADVSELDVLAPLVQ